MDGAALDLGDTRRDADHNSGLVQRRSIHCPGDKLLEHVGSDVEVGNNTVLEGADCGNGAGGTSDHFLCLSADSDYLMGGRAYVNSDNGGLANDNSLTLYEHQRIRRSEVDSNILCEHGHCV